MNIEQAIQAIGILTLINASKEAKDYEDAQEGKRHEAKIQQYMRSYKVDRSFAEAELGQEGHKLRMKDGLDIALTEMSPNGGATPAPIAALQAAMANNWPELQAALNAAYKAAPKASA